MSKSEQLSKSSIKLPFITEKGQKQLSVDCPFLFSPYLFTHQKQDGKIIFWSITQ